jgi:heavy metal sensor kinase
MARFTRVFGIPKLPVRLLRGLRFRLTLFYVIFFTLCLIAIGLFYRQILQQRLQDTEQAALEELWPTVKGYFNIEKGEPVWSTDPEDAEVVAQLQRVYLIADANGNALGYNEDNDSISFSTAEIRLILADSKTHQAPSVRWNKQGEPFLVEAGWVLDDHRQRYFLAIGRSLSASRRTVSSLARTYFLLLPALIALATLLGWIVAGRAIRPLNLVVQAAQNITGSNLSLQIPQRGAGDELDHLIESFNLMTARLNQSFEQIRRFSTDVSHELRTPLTSIRGQLEVALFTAETPDQYRDAMVNALEDVEQLSSIVRALLLLSQAESGQLALQKTALDLSKLAIEMVDQFQIPAQEKQIVLTALASPGCVIHADRTQIERLLANLLSNAVKYTPVGGSIAVQVGPSDSPVMVALEVADTGVGIPAENLPHIFDRFYRVRSPQTNQIMGLGLGLSFVSWIVKVHEGRMEVASTVGEGTCFRIQLPREGEESQVAPAAAIASATLDISS